MLLALRSLNRGFCQSMTILDQTPRVKGNAIEIIQNIGVSAFSTNPLFLSHHIKDHNKYLFNRFLCRSGDSNTNFQSLARFQARLFGTNIKAPISEQDFFNRTRELQAFREVLEGAPQISVVSGPVNSGKTSLLLLLLDQMSKDKNIPRPILHLDLRERSFSSVQELADCFEEAMASWTDRFQEIVKQTTVASIWKVKFERELAGEKSPVVRLNKIFSIMSRFLPEYSVFSGKQSPILFIDEANKLKLLLNKESKELREEGHSALLNLFEWFVKNTKQENRFQVVLGTSDSFFHLWIEKFIGASRFESYVVGNLDKVEAKTYWDNRLLDRQKYFLGNLTPPEFKHAYQVCGGNMFFLQKYFDQYKQSKGKLTPSTFSMMRAEKAVLLRALLEAESPGFSKWRKDDFLSILKRLVEAEGNFVIYREFCKTFGEQTVNALIEANILHLRPTERHSFDIPNHPPEDAIVTSETPASLLAMEKLLVEEGIEFQRRPLDDISITSGAPANLFDMEKFSVEEEKSRLQE